MRHLAVGLLVGAIALAGCTDPVLEQRVADLEQKVTDLDKKVAEAGTRGPAERGPAAAAATASPEQEEAGAELLREANTLVTDMKYTEALARLATLEKDYPTTRAARSSKRLVEELSVIGVDAGTLEVEKWFQGNASMGDGKATLVVFWEVWCPHCRREVPAIEATFEKYKGDGLNVVGVTKVTKSATDAEVTAFIKENNLSYPIAKETGALSERFGVRGIPAAAVVKDGKVVWRGHPARLTEEMFKAWLGTTGEG